MKVRLALVEFLLASGDLQASARESVEWLAVHAGVRQSVVLVVEHSRPDLLLLGEHGMSSAAIAELAISRDDLSHPLVQAMERRSPSYFTRSSGADSPLGRASFHANPLRPDDSSPAQGLLLASSSSAAITGDVSWLVRQLSKQIARLLTKRELADIRLGRSGCCCTASSMRSPIRSC